MKKVLIITYYWPPSGGAGVQRWLKFAKYLPEFGWEPHIYTPENPEAPAQDFSLSKDVSEKLIVIKRPIFEPYSFYKKFTGKKGNINAGFLSEDAGSRKKITERISIWIRGNFFIPDARVFWVRPSVRFLENYVTENQIDTIISTGPPHSMHLIALGLKKKLKLRWIADFRDPWTNIDFYKDLMLTNLSDKKHRRLEKEVLTKADEVIAIGRTMADEFEVLSNRKINVITNGFDEDDYQEDVHFQPENHYNIVHIGSINSDRNHKIFWEGLSELLKEHSELYKNIKLKFIGKLDYSVLQDIEKFGLKERVEIVSYIPHNELNKHFLSASLLYLPFNNTPNSKGVLTGKFFEYMASMKPIIAIGNTKGDASQIFKQTHCGSIIDFADKQGFKDAFQHLYNTANEPNMEEIAKYSRKKLTEKLVSLLK